MRENKIEPEKWGKKKWEDWFEWDASLRRKPYIASYFLEKFTWFLLLPSLLNEWAQVNYRLTLEELVVKTPDIFPPVDYKLLDSLKAEIIAFGIKIYRLGEIKTSSLGGEGLSFTSLVDASIVSGQYKAAKKKYAKAKSKEVNNLFTNSIKDILNSSFSDFSLMQIKTGEVDPGRWISYARFKFFPFFVERAVSGIFKWASWLDWKEADRVSTKIRELEKNKGKINFEKEMMGLLRTYGFDSIYCQKSWEKTFSR